VKSYIRKSSIVAKKHETSIIMKDQAAGALLMEHENAVTAVENSIIAHSN
jgi:hypothetical protein